MSAPAVLGCAAIIITTSLAVGRAVLLACGQRDWTWLTPAVGIAALLTVAGFAARLPGEKGTILALTGALVAVSAALLARKGGLAGLRGPARIGLPIVVIALLAACLPFAFNGRFGILGPRVLPDLVEQLFMAEWLQTGDGIEPLKVQQAYPLGPHGIVIATAAAAREPLDAAFTALLIAVPVLTALAALSVAARLPPIRRAAVTLLTGLPLLGVGYMLQSGFKETLMGLLVVAFALGLRERALSGARGWRTATPLAILVAGGFHVYSFPALFWFGGVAGTWHLARTWLRDRAAVAAMARGPWPYICLGATALAIGLGGFAAGAYDFVGNLPGPLPVWEAFGVWPTPDYRYAPETGIVEVLAAAIGVAAAGYGVWWWMRRRDPALPAALTACLGIWIGSQPFAVSFLTAKALPIVAPVAALTAATALLGSSPWSKGRARLAAGALALAFVIGAGWSSFLALQGGQVAAGSEAAELGRFRPIVKGHTVLSLGRDTYTLHHLRGATVRAVGTVRELYVRPRMEKPTRIHHPGDPVGPIGEPLDFDTVPTRALDVADFVVVPRTDYQSAAPSNFHRVASGSSLELWERRGPTPPRETLVEPGVPGTILDCGDQRKPAGTAGIFRPAPVKSDPSAWRALPGPGDGGRPEFRQRLPLPAGRWQLSLQYSALDGLDVRAPGLATRLPASLDYVGGFWPLGNIRSTGTPVTVTARAEDRPFLARLLGRTVSKATPELVLGQLAAVREGSRVEIPLRRACGRYVDWFRLGR